MNQIASMIRSLKTPAATEQLTYLYGNREGTLVFQTTRYTKLLKRFEELFSTSDDVLLISAPGRTEVGGNHTDHNRGKVLAAAVNLDTLAAVSPRSDMIVQMHSGGYPAMTIDLNDLTIREKEKGTTTGLIRGTAARMAELGYKIGGFNAVVTSTVASGSGLSSSAAFEVLVCAIFDRLYNGFSIDFKTKAKIGQYVENVFFGKPSGLLDQMASAAGGLVAIDFKHDDPTVLPMSYDFSAKGYALVVVSTGGSHANLTDHYAAIPKEMREIAGYFGEKNLRMVRSEEFNQAIPALREKFGDRPVLRAMHFYEENRRVTREVEALETDALNKFFAEVIASGRSSFMYLQNVYASSDQQSLSIALALAEKMLAGRGAWRVHGGGFAGTTLNFVPMDMVDAFTQEMDAVFGQHSCHVLSIRPVGAAELKL